MRFNKKLAKKIGLGAIAVSVISFSLTGSKSAMSSTICSETELAGLSCMLDKYITTSQGTDNINNNPEAIVAFQDNAEVTNPSSGEVITDTSVATDASITSDSASPAAVDAATQTSPAPSATPAPVSEYQNVGISIASEYVNIRKEPNTDSEVEGKLYRGSAATILETKDGWVRIKSGSVVGYIKTEYLAIGFSAEKLIDDFGTKLATVKTTTLKVREEKNTDSTVLTLIPNGETYEVESEDDQWVKVIVDEDTKGYVSKQFVDISVEFKHAISTEEEQAEIKRKEEAEKAEQEQQQRILEQQQRDARERAQQQSEARQKAQQQREAAQRQQKQKEAQANSKSEDSSSSSDNNSTSSSASGSGSGASIASFACKFVGNPYVYGATSLTNGTDCSGFTQSVMSRFGISIPRTSGAQSGTGKSISVSEAKAGDLIFYGSNGHVSHVALCIGNGRIVHASTRRTGIITSNMYYRTPICARRVAN